MYTVWNKNIYRNSSKIIKNLFSLSKSYNSIRYTYYTGYSKLPSLVFYPAFGSY